MLELTPIIIMKHIQCPSRGSWMSLKHIFYILIFDFVLNLTYVLTTLVKYYVDINVGMGYLVTLN